MVGRKLSSCLAIVATTALLAFGGVPKAHADECSQRWHTIPLKTNSCGGCQAYRAIANVIFDEYHYCVFDGSGWSLGYTTISCEVDVFV